MAFLTDETGISPRQARRDVAAAYDRLQHDIEHCGIDRKGALYTAAMGGAFRSMAASGYTSCHA